MYKRTRYKDYMSLSSEALKKTHKYPTNTFVGLAAQLQHHNPGDDAVTSGLLHVWGDLNMWGGSEGGSE